MSPRSHDGAHRFLLGVALAPDRSIALATHNIVVKLLPAK
jgi:hypothetical protein